MKYISVKDTANKWGISVRRVQVLCEQSRIKGAFKVGNAYIIPNDVDKPEDKRKKRY